MTAERHLLNFGILAVVLLCGYIGQSLLKLSLTRLGTPATHAPSGLVKVDARLFLDPWVLLSIGVVGIGFLAWILFLSRMDLSQALPMLALAYVPWLIIGRFVFHEPVTPLRVAGVLLICLGVFFVSTR